MESLTPSSLGELRSSSDVCISSSRSTCFLQRRSLLPRLPLPPLRTPSLAQLRPPWPWNLFALALPSFILPVVVDRHLRRYHPLTCMNLNPLAKLIFPRYIRLFALLNLIFVFCIPELLNLVRRRQEGPITSPTLFDESLYVRVSPIVVLSHWESYVYRRWEEGRKAEHARTEERKRQAGGDSGEQQAKEQQAEEQECKEKIHQVETDQAGLEQTDQVSSLSSALSPRRDLFH